MSYKPGDTVAVPFTVANATGAAANADATPTASLLRTTRAGGSLVTAIDGAVTVAVSNPPIELGTYEAVFTIPVTYLPGDSISLLARPIVGTVPAKIIKGPWRLAGIGVFSVTDTNPTATGFATNIGATDFVTGSLLTFLTGSLARQSMIVSSYNVTTGRLVLSPLSGGNAFAGAPANNDLFELTPIAPAVIRQETISG